MLKHRHLINWVGEHKTAVLIAGVGILFFLVVYDMNNFTWQNKAACAGQLLVHKRYVEAKTHLDQAILLAKEIPKEERPNMDEVVKFSEQVSLKILKERTGENGEFLGEPGKFERHIIKSSCKVPID